jgi:hypothetical protein
MKTTNEEMLSSRDLTRAPAAHLDRLQSGEVEKLVLMQGGKMRFVVLPVERYEELTEDEPE